MDYDFRWISSKTLFYASCIIYNFYIYSFCFFLFFFVLFVCVSLFVSKHQSPLWLLCLQDLWAGFKGVICKGSLHQRAVDAVSRHMVEAMFWCLFMLCVVCFVQFSVIHAVTSFCSRSLKLSSTSILPLFLLKY